MPISLPMADGGEREIASRTLAFVVAERETRRLAGPLPPGCGLVAMGRRSGGERRDKGEIK